MYLVSIELLRIEGSVYLTLSIDSVKHCHQVQKYANYFIICDFSALIDNNAEENLDSDCHPLFSI